MSKASVGVSSSAAAAAELGGFLIAGAGAAVGVVSGVFLTWLLVGIVAGMLVALVGRLVADVSDARRRD